MSLWKDYWNRNTSDDTTEEWIHWESRAVYYLKCIYFKVWRLEKKTKNIKTNTSDKQPNSFDLQKYLEFIISKLLTCFTCKWIEPIQIKTICGTYAWHLESIQNSKNYIFKIIVGGLKIEKLLPTSLDQYSELMQRPRLRSGHHIVMRSFLREELHMNWAQPHIINILL